MPRMSRQKHFEAVYHIMVRGNNKEHIFFDDYDRMRYLDTLKRYKEKFQMYIYAYCLMDNHIHLIINCNGQDISKIMQGINLSYTQYVNRKYDRCGHLLQDRFKSIIVDEDNYIIQLTKYIHQNPIRAGMVENASEYRWSSYKIYLGHKDKYEIVSTNFVLDLFAKDKHRARELYSQYVDNDFEQVIAKVEENMYESSDYRVEIKQCDINKIFSKVAQYYNICVDDILLRCNKRYAKAKQISSYLISSKSKLTYKEIGERFCICGSAVGQNIRKAIDIITINREEINQINLLLEN